MFSAPLSAAVVSRLCTQPAQAITAYLSRHMRFGNTSDTIAAPATVPGRSAIAMIRISGAEAVAITGRIFDNPVMQRSGGRTLHHGWITDASGRHVDEVIVGVYRAPASYTGEDVTEISCHGSEYVIRRILELLVESGARLAEPGEFTLRAFLNGKMDLSQAESVADLIAAESAAAHGLALQQMRGGVSNQVRDLRAKLVDLASLLELELDFGEEDVEFADRTQLLELTGQIRDVVTLLCDSFRLGNALKRGIVTVIAGRPNAGKSTLLNALLEEERAIVSPIPGTTRDTIEEVIHLDGIAFRLVDTAGIREAQDQIEEIGVRRTMEKIGESAILIYVFDALALTASELQDDLAKLRNPDADTSLIVVANKMDLLPEAGIVEWSVREIDRERILLMSAMQGTHLRELREALVQRVRTADIPPGMPVISTARHYEALLRVESSLAAVQSGLDAGTGTELVASDLRQALHWLGTITGQISSDEVLGNIFGRFCIGK